MQAQTKAIGADEAKVITSDYASIYKVLMSDFVLETKIDAEDVIFMDKAFLVLVLLLMLMQVRHKKLLMQMQITL